LSLIQDSGIPISAELSSSIIDIANLMMFCLDIPTDLAFLSNTLYTIRRSTCIRY
jgi:hypothetical protein